MKHDEKDLRTINPSEKEHLVLRGHLRSFHGRVRSEQESLAALRRLHGSLHRMGS